MFTYADYLSQHSYLHTLSQNRLLSQYKRLTPGLEEERYKQQLQALESVVRRKAFCVKHLD